MDMGLEETGESVVRRELHTPGAKAPIDSIGFIAKAKALAYLEART